MNETQRAAYMKNADALKRHLAQPETQKAFKPKRKQRPAPRARKETR